MVEDKQKPSDETTSMDINQATGFWSRLNLKPLTVIIIVLIVLGCAGGVLYWKLHRTSATLSSSVFDSKIQQDGFKLDTKAAQQTLSQYLASKPTTPNKQYALAQVGNVYVNNNEYTQAINEYLQAQALTPKQNILYLDEALAQAYRSISQNSLAIIYYSKAIKALNPHDPMTPGDKTGFEQTIQELSK